MSKPILVIEKNIFEFTEGEIATAHMSKAKYKIIEHDKVRQQTKVRRLSDENIITISWHKSNKVFV